MRPTIARARRVLAGVFLLTATFTAHPALADSAPSATRAIPKTWDETLLRTQHVPLADARIKVTHLSEQSYYAMPERVLYKSYPIYHPEHEPPGYLASLEQKEPEILRFDAARFKTEREWIEFGREVFQSPTGSDSEAFAALITRDRLRDPRWYETVRWEKQTTRSPSTFIR